MGEGQTLYLSNEDLMFEWTTGFATRSKNLDSLCLDKIVRAKRSIPCCRLAIIVPTAAPLMLVACLRRCT